MGWPAPVVGGRREFGPLTEKGEGGFQFSAGMGITGAAGGFDPGGVQGPGLLGPVQLFESLAAVIVGGPVVGVVGQDGAKLPNCLFELAAIFKFIGQHVAQAAVARALGEHVFESGNSV